MSSMYREDNHFSLIFKNLKENPVKLNESNHYDHHHDPLDDNGHPPSIWRFLTTIFHLTPQVLYIFGNLRQNPVQ